MKSLNKIDFENTYANELNGICERCSPTSFNKSEILLVMIGGMTTVAGGVLAAYIGFLGGEDEFLRQYYAKHLLTASVMAAPGAIVISKIL